MGMAGRRRRTCARPVRALEVLRHDLTTERHEPDEPRGSRPDLWGRAGEIPARYPAGSRNPSSGADSPVSGTHRVVAGPLATVGRYSGNVSPNRCGRSYLPALASKSLGGSTCSGRIAAAEWRPSGYVRTPRWKEDNCQYGNARDEAEPEVPSPWHARHVSDEKEARYAQTTHKYILH